MSLSASLRGLLTLQKPDPLLTWTAALLLCLGLVMVASASFALAARETGSPFHYLVRQAVYLGGGLLAALLAGGGCIRGRLAHTADAREFIR